MNKRSRFIKFTLLVIIIISGLGFPLFFSLLNTTLNTNLHKDLFLNEWVFNNKHSLAMNLINKTFDENWENPFFSSLLLMDQPGSAVDMKVDSLIIPENWIFQQYITDLGQAKAFIQGITNQMGLDINTSPIKSKINEIELGQLTAILRSFPDCPIEKIQNSSQILPICKTGNFQEWAKDYLLNLQLEGATLPDPIHIASNDEDTVSLLQLRTLYFFSICLLVIWLSLNIVFLFPTKAQKKETFRKIFVAIIITGVLGVISIILLTILDINIISSYSLLQFTSIDEFLLMDISTINKFFEVQFTLNFIIISIIQIAMGLILLLGISVLKGRHLMKKTVN